MWYLKFFVYRFSVEFVDSIRKILGIMLHVYTICLHGANATLRILFEKKKRKNLPIM